MTQKQSPEERTREIISGALEVLEEKGLAGLTMEAVILRTSLSKGGVYRFYGSKNELVSDVIKNIADTFRPVKKEEALSWNLPLKETLIQLLFSIFHDREALRYRRVHIQLMLQLPPADPLTKAMKKRLNTILDRYFDIIQAVIKRDRLKPKPGFKDSFVLAIKIGQSLFDGLMINNLSGMSAQEMKKRMTVFIDMVIRANIEDYPGKRLT